jgi:hypothetical protein
VSTRNRQSGEPSPKSSNGEAKTAKKKAASNGKGIAAGNGAARRAAAAKPSARTPRTAATRRAAPRAATREARLSELQPLIAETAYFIAEREGFPEGRELEHWLQAEIEVFEAFEPDQAP